MHPVRGRGFDDTSPPMIMASSDDLGSPGKAIVFLKASKGNDDPYAVVRHANNPINI